MRVNSLKKFLVSMGTVAVLGASLVVANGVDAFAAGTVTLHYHRDDGNYSEYTCKTWDEVNSQGTSNTFTESDGEGTVSYEMSDGATLFSCVVQDANKQPIGDAEGKNLEFELGDAMAGKDIDVYLESGSDKLIVKDDASKESTEASESEEAATTTAAEVDDTQQETEVKETTTTAAATTTVGTGGSTINEGIDIEARDEGREDSYYNAGVPARILFIVVIVALSAGLSYLVNAKDRRIKVDDN